jgi:hypothetical protein
VVPLDLQKRKSILQQALAWFFNDYIMPMLKVKKKTANAVL